MTTASFPTTLVSLAVGLGLGTLEVVLFVCLFVWLFALLGEASTLLSKQGTMEEFAGIH